MANGTLTTKGDALVTHELPVEAFEAEDGTILAKLGLPPYLDVGGRRLFPQGDKLAVWYRPGSPKAKGMDSGITL